MEIILFIFVGLIAFRQIRKRFLTPPKALDNRYIQNPKPLFPDTDRESIGWTGLNILFGVSKMKATTHGSASFMSQKTLSKLLRKKHQGIVVDGKNRLPLDCMHYAVVGGSGSGKTSKYIIPNLLQPNKHSSIIVSDPSEECFKTCAKTLSEAGYDIQVLNFENGHSLCFNPLSRANSAKDIMKVADIIVGSALGVNGPDKFWNDGAATIIALVIKALKHTPQYCNLANVRYILNSYNPTNNSLLDHFMISHLTNKMDFFDYQGFMSNEVKIVSGFISSAKMSLKSLLDDHLARLTSADTIDFMDLRRKKTCLFIQYPENQTAYYSFIIKILYTQLFDMCMQTGMQGQDNRHIMVYLDEFANIGAIPSFSSLITTLRKRNVCISVIIQALEQIEQVYPRQSEAILYGGINSHIYLNALSHKTCEQLSSRIGDFTVEDNEKGTRHARNLITPSELRLMENDSCLMMYQNHKPAMIKVTPYYHNPALQKKAQKVMDASDLVTSPLPDIDFVPLTKPPQGNKGNKSTGNGSSNSNSITFDL